MSILILNEFSEALAWMFYLAAEYALKLTHINLASLNKINDSIYFLEF